MSIFDQHVKDLEAACSEPGALSELARRAQVPNSTVRSLAANGWRSQSVDIFERLVVAARSMRATRPGGSRAK